MLLYVVMTCECRTCESVWASYWEASRVETKRGEGGQYAGCMTAPKEQHSRVGPHLGHEEQIRVLLSQPGDFLAQPRILRHERVVAFGLGVSAEREAFGQAWAVVESMIKRATAAGP